MPLVADDVSRPGRRKRCYAISGAAAEVGGSFTAGLRDPSLFGRAHEFASSRVELLGAPSGPDSEEIELVRGRWRSHRWERLLDLTLRRSNL